MHSRSITRHENQDQVLRELSGGGHLHAATSFNTSMYRGGSKGENRVAGGAQLYSLSPSPLTKNRKVLTLALEDKPNSFSLHLEEKVTRLPEVDTPHHHPTPLHSTSKKMKGGILIND